MLATAFAMLLLAATFTACGGGGDNGSGSGSSQAEVASQAPSGASSSSSEQEQERSGSSEEDLGGQSASESGEAAQFVPKQHQDSGGGSAQYETKGGDNSVQEYGQEAGSGEFEVVANALHDFLDARAEQNWAATCEYASKSIVEQFEKLAAQAKQVEDKGCAGILGKLINPVARHAFKEEAEKADVRSVRIEGDRAFIIYTGAHGTLLAMPAASEGGSWKVSSLAATPIG